MTPGAADEAWVEAAKLNNRGLSLVAEGRPREAILAYQRAVDISREAGHHKALATALDNLSVTTAWCGRIKEGLAAHGEARATFQLLGDVPGESAALCNLAVIHIRAGRPQAAVAAQHRAVEVCRTAGNRAAEAFACSHLGQILAAESDLRGAVQAHREAVDIWRGLSDREAEAGELKTLACRLAEARRYTDARQSADEAVAALRGIGRQAEADALVEWLEALPVDGAQEEARPLGRHERTAAPRVHVLRGCLPFLAAVGAVITLLLEGPWFVVAALTVFAALGWGTCLTSLVSLAMGAVIVRESWGTWWLCGGLALLAFGSTSLLASGNVRVSRTGTRSDLGISTRLDPDEVKGPDGR